MPILAEEDETYIELLDSPPRQYAPLPRRPTNGSGAMRSPIVVDSDDEEDVRPVASGSQGASRGAAPLMRLARPVARGPVVAMADPLPFEVQLERRATRRLPTPPPQAAPRSHHVPAMGLGGGFLAMNQIPRPANRSRTSWALEHAVNAIHDNVWQIHNHVLGEPRFPDLFSAEDRLYDIHEDFTGFGYGRLRNLTQPDYKSAFTHPVETPPNDFIYDWGPSEDSGGSPEDSDAPVTLLVCGQCMDPLVLGGSDDSKVWALRCGHMIDGKCLHAIDRPAVVEAVKDLKGKSKAREEEPLQEYLSGGSKKRKAAGSMEITPMRARLRPRVSLASSAGSQQRPAIPVHAWTTFPASILKRPLELKQTTHAWSCPVADCAKSHTSLFQDEAWVPDPKKGPISMFV